jgi:hypothetical protein
MLVIPAALFALGGAVVIWAGMSVYPPLGGTPGPVTAGSPQPPGGVWRHLRGWLTALGLTLNLLLGCLGLHGFTAATAGSWWQLLLLAWVLVPLVSGLLSLEAAHGLKKPGGEASTSLVVAAAAAFVGLAWVGVTVALLLGGGLRG